MTIAVVVIIMMLLMTGNSKWQYAFKLKNFIKIIHVCEDKYEFENPRRNPYILAAPNLALTEQTLLLTEYFLLR